MSVLDRLEHEVARQKNPKTETTIIAVPYGLFKIPDVDALIKVARAAQIVAYYQYEKNDLRDVYHVNSILKDALAALEQSE